MLVQTKSGTNQLHGDVVSTTSRTASGTRGRSSRARLCQADQPAATSTAPPSASRSSQNKLFAFGSVDRDQARTARTAYTRDLFLAAELAAPRLTRGNDTPANRAFIESVLARFPASADAERSAQHRGRTRHRQLRPPRRGLLGRGSTGLPTTADTRHRALSVHAPGPRPEDVIVGEQAQQNNHQAQPRRHLDARLLGSRTVGEFRYGLGLRSTNVDIAAGNDTPIIRFAGSPVSAIDHRQRRQVSDPPRPDRSSVRLQPVDRRARRSHSFKAGTDIRFASARRPRRQLLPRLLDVQRRLRRRRPTRPRMRRSSTAASPAIRRRTGRSSSRTAATNTTSTSRTLARAPRPDAEPRSALRVRRAPSEAEDRHRLRLQRRQQQHRAAARLRLRAARGSAALLGAVAGGPAARSRFAAATGIYDGRLFQSVFSQSGASLRFNPPNALQRTFTSTASQLLNLVRSDRRLRVHARPADRPRHT